MAKEKNINKKSCSIVIGLGFGDEGKGSVTDFLCHGFLYEEHSKPWDFEVNKIKPPLVIRYNGGHQVGHTVFLENGLNHVHSNFGSGSLRGIPTYWSKYCTVDPMAILREYAVLKNKVDNICLYLNPFCPVVTPYDILYNRIKNDKNHNGSVGVGFGTCISRHETKYKLHVIDLLYPNIVKTKIKLIKERYYTQFVNDKKLRTIDINKFLDKLEDFRELVSKGYININSLDKIKGKYQNYIFEGAQGIMLDQNFGYSPHITRSNSTTLNAIKIIIENDLPIPDYYYVTRAYQTRHGNGPLLSDECDYDIKINPLETNVLNYQGTFRRAKLNVEQVEYAININKHQNPNRGNMNIVITCLDHVNDYRPIKDLLNRFDFNNIYISKSNVGSRISKIENFIEL